MTLESVKKKEGVLGRENPASPLKALQILIGDIRVCLGLEQVSVLVWT